MDLNEGATPAKLPDDLEVEILSRLTYKSFCRCKCVCKAWSAFPSNPDYCQKLPPKITRGLLYQGRNSSAVPLVDLSQADEEIDGVLVFMPHYEHLEFLECCNGLVLCKYRSSYTSPGVCRFIVCNPATREWRILPDTHHGEGDRCYTTMLVFDPLWSPQFYVFNFYGEQGNIRLEVFPSDGTAWLVDDKWNPDTSVCWRPYLFFNGMLYVQTVEQGIVVFEGLETMSVGILPCRWTMELPWDSLYVGSFTNGCFGKFSGILHYALQHENGRSIIVWSFDDYVPDMWTVKCRYNMKDAFGRDDFVQYDDSWFWRCDYRIVALDMERDVIFMFEDTSKKLLSYNISTGELRKIREGFQQYEYYVPCYLRVSSPRTTLCVM